MRNSNLGHPLGAGARLGLLMAFIAAIAVLTLGSYVRPAYAAAGTFKFNESSYTVVEGDDVTITVKRSGSGLTSATISVDIANTTAELSDYSVDGGTGESDASSGNLVFSSSTTTKTFTIDTAEDADTDNETLDLDINLESSGGALGSPNPITVTILDDDGAGQIEFVSATYSITEGNVTAAVALRRINGDSGDVGADCETDDSSSEADEGSDYDSNDDTIEWADGVDGTKTCYIDINEDSLEEAWEDIDLILADFTGGAVVGLQDTAILTIIDDDGEGTLQFTAATYSVNEGVGSITISVKRSGGTDGELTVDYETSTGTAGSSDFTATSGTLTFPDGSSSNRTFSVPITDDSLSEGSEVFYVALSGVTGGGTLGTNDEATVTITDDDTAIPVITDVSPDTGGTGGNTYVTITGANFVGTTSVTFGGTNAPNFVVNNSTTIKVYTPARAAGTVDVRVTNASGTSAEAGTDDDFTYSGTGPVVSAISPTSGPTGGGTTVNITGSGFTGATGVTFGGTAATFTVNSSTSITATSPAHSAGTVDVIVTTAAGSSPNTSADNFAYTSLGSHQTYALSFQWNLIVWFGADGAGVENALKGWESTDDTQTNSVWTIVTAVYKWNNALQKWLAFYPSAITIPGANDFTVFNRYVAYWLAVATGGNWTIATP